MAKLLQEAERSTGDLWGEESCKAKSTQVAILVIPYKAEKT